MAVDHFITVRQYFKRALHASYFAIFVPLGELTSHLKSAQPLSDVSSYYQPMSDENHL